MNPEIRKHKIRNTFALSIPPNAKRVKGNNHLLYQRGDLEAAERESSACDQGVDWQKNLVTINYSANSKTLKQ